MQIRKKTAFLIALAVLIILLGIGMACYPAFSAWYSEKTRGGVIAAYYEDVNNKDDEALLAVLESAREYNRKLFSGEYSVLEPEENGYYDELNILSNGIMGYVDIPKINVYLPIYHGVGSDALSLGCGHMPQSSLPVGGESTHAVLSSHTGSASSALFTDLEQMEVGDLFYIHILNMTLAYKVDNISVVLPTDIDCITIENGNDLVTLVTCTPYGVNSHRLLVRGQRVELDEAEEPDAEAIQEEPVTSTWEVKYRQGILAGVILALLLIVLAILFMLLRRVWRKRHEKA